MPQAWFASNAGASANTSLAGLMCSDGPAPRVAFVFDFFVIGRNVP